MAPEWYKLLALVVIIFSLVILTYDIACVIPTVHIVVAAGATTVVVASGTLIIRIWAVDWYCYYARLCLDVFFLAMWVASLVSGVMGLATTSREQPRLATKAKPGFSIALMIIVFKIPLVFTQLTLSSTAFIFTERWAGIAKL